MAHGLPLGHSGLKFGHPMGHGGPKLASEPLWAQPLAIHGHDGPKLAQECCARHV
jgi:hypothetical protein